MPELPEVETTRLGLIRSCEGRRIVQLHQRREGVRWPFPANLKTCTEGACIIGVRRRAKYILLDLDSGYSIIIHLGMSGRLLILPATEPFQKHDHLIFVCEDGNSIRFNDPRRFGVVDTVLTAEWQQHRLLSTLGREPVVLPASPAASDSLLTPEYLCEQWKYKTTSIKAALLDQRVIVGLGNIYVCEALFYAGISPQRAACTLTEPECMRLIAAIERVLHAALKAGGTSLRDYVQTDGTLGHFQNECAVYGREGMSCPECSCGCAAIERITQSGRSTFYCPVKQH